MEVSFKTFKEFLPARNDSDSSDDEVFFAAKYDKIHYAKQKAEELDINSQATTRKSVIPSEDYFADQSRLSSRGEDKVDSPEERLDQPSDSVLDEQEHGARTLDTGMIVDRADVLGVFTSSSSDPSMQRLPSDFAPDEHNISFRSSSRFTRILSFQRFSSADYLTGNELESRKTDPSQCNPENISAAVDLQLPVDGEESNLHRSAASASRDELAVKVRDELTGGQSHCSPSLPGHAVFLSVADLPLDPSPDDSGLTHDRSSNPAVSPHAIDLRGITERDNTSPSPVDRSIKLPQQHNSDFTLAGEDVHVGGCVLTHDQSANPAVSPCATELRGITERDNTSPSPVDRSIKLLQQHNSDLTLAGGDDHVGGCVLTHDQSANPAVSPCATDLRGTPIAERDNTSPSPLDRSIESPQKHNSDFSLAGVDNVCGDKDLASGSPCSILGLSVFAPSTAKGHQPSLNDSGLGTSHLYDLPPRMNVQFDQVINKHCEVWLNDNIISLPKTAVANSMFLQMGSPLCKEFSPRAASTVTKTPEDCEGPIEHESLGGNLQDQRNYNYVADPRASDFVLGDVCLPSILVDHFENCLVDDEKIEDSPALKENAEREKTSPNNSLNTPGCSGAAVLRLPTETSDSEGFNSDSDSDCIFNLKVMHRMNQLLMEERKASEISTRPVENTSPQAAMPLCPDLRGQSSSSCALEKRSGADRLFAVVQSVVSSTLKQTEVGGNGTVHDQRLLKEFGLDLEIGQGSSARRPSPLVSALLTPTRSGRQEEPSPSNLECLDLSVDDRIPVGRYFAAMGKENRCLDAKKRLPEKKKTPSKHGALPMREISNSPVIGKTPEFAAPKACKVVPAKKTGIPVMETRIDPGRHARCFFNLYSTNRLQELKAKSMKDYQHISSPVSQYIREYPVAPFVQNFRPKVLAFQKSEKCMPVKTFFPPPTPFANPPVARYTEKTPVPCTVERPPPQFKYFPSPNTPLVIKHTGPSHAIPDVSCVHGDESVLASGRKGSRIPHLRDARTAREVDESLWQVVSPKVVARK